MMKNLPGKVFAASYKTREYYIPGERRRNVKTFQVTIVTGYTPPAKLADLIKRPRIRKYILIPVNVISAAMNK